MEPGQVWGAGWPVRAPDLDPDLVFTTATGAPLDLANVRRSFSKLLRRTGVDGAWTTYNLRHTAVSILSAQRVPIEHIADLAGHKSPRVTQEGYRHVITPVVGQGARGVMEGLFGAPRP